MSCCQRLWVLGIVFDVKRFRVLFKWWIYPCLSHFRISCVSNSFLSWQPQLFLLPCSCQDHLFVMLCSDLGQVRNGWEKRHSTTREQLPEGSRHQRGRHIWWSQTGQTLEQGVNVYRERRKKNIEKLFYFFYFAFYILFFLVLGFNYYGSQLQLMDEIRCTQCFTKKAF